MSISLKDIQTAAERIAGATVHTRFEHSVTLSGIAGCQVYNKFENLQFTASFKDRGALNKLLLLQQGLQEGQQQSGSIGGVVTASAGNHAKAVAYHARRLGIPATIVMPANTPNVKVQDTKDLGAQVALHGVFLEDAAQQAQQLVEQEGLVYVHPYDDPEIMAGQGTVVIEMLQQEPDLDAIVVPIGGGGLIAGMATAARAIKPDIKIYGVEVESYGRTTIAEGIAVKKPGKHPMQVIKRLVDDTLSVNEEAIEDAINLYLVIEKTVSEGAGAAALAAVLNNKKRFTGMKTGLVLSGANIDSRILASVLMRRLVKRGSIVQFQVAIDDSPGSLSEVSSIMSEFGGNILEVSHQRLFAALPVKQAELTLTVETRDASQVQDILHRLKERGYKAQLKDLHA